MYPCARTGTVLYKTLHIKTIGSWTYRLRDTKDPCARTGTVLYKTLHIKTIGSWTYRLWHQRVFLSSVGSAKVFGQLRILIYSNTFHSRTPHRTSTNFHDGWEFIHASACPDTRMHSSRMRTVRCSGRLPGGCVAGEVSARGGGARVPGQGVSAHSLARGCTPPPCGQILVKK